MKTFKKGGIHPPENKHASSDIITLPLPMKAVVMMSQHIGAPARPIVTKGQHVDRGTLIAESTGFVSAGVHAPISGTVTAVDKTSGINGYTGAAIVIQASLDDHNRDEAQRHEELERPVSRTLSENTTPEEIRKIISEAGIVGLGGATFPTAVKLCVKPEAHVDTLILNGCECEPYLTCDNALMTNHAEKILEGVELMVLASGVKKAIIALEDNKPEAYRALLKALDPKWPIEIVQVKTKYPQGGEKQLVEALTRRRIGSGALPASVGVIVNNVATAYAVYQAFYDKTPLIERIVTVDGNIEGVDEFRGNYRVAIGTSLKDLNFNLPEEGSYKVISGGPMMGRPVVNIDAPVTKGTSGILILEGVERAEPQPCIRCGACIEACPMGLEPYLLSDYGRLHIWHDAEALDVVDCIECGCCSYSCPSRRPLLDFIRNAKQKVMADIRARNAAPKA